MPNTQHKYSKSLVRQNIQVFFFFFNFKRKILKEKQNTDLEDQKMWMTRKKIYRTLFSFIILIILPHLNLIF